MVRVEVVLLCLHKDCEVVNGRIVYGRTALRAKETKEMCLRLSQTRTGFIESLNLHHGTRLFTSILRPSSPR
jgi:hypothetical protein